MCFSGVPPGVGCVNRGIRGVLFLEIACTFDLFTEQTFPSKPDEVPHIHVALS